MYVDTVTRDVPRWKPGATEFTVKVGTNARRGRQVNLPKPVAERLGNPLRITFRIGEDIVTVEATEP